MKVNCEVFISYSSKEKEMADLVRETLENNGLSCWMAPESIPASSGYAAEITEAISNCKVVVLILSYPSMESKWVTKEVDFAICENKPIIPFHIDDSKLNKTFQLYLNNVQHIDAYKRVKMALGDLLENVNALVGTNKSSNTRIHLKPMYREPIHNFSGRDEELALVEEKFNNHNIVTLSGIGGIGKSEIAKAYAVKSYKEKVHETVTYVDYNETIKKTIAHLDFSGFDEVSFLESLQNKDDIDSIEDALFHKKLSWLETTNNKTLLIIDGLDNYNDPDLDVINRLSMHVLITTRCHFSEWAVVKVKKIEEKELIKVFYNYYEDGSQDEEEIEQVKEIINIVSSHTLTIKLIAQFLQTSGYPLDVLIENLKQNKLSQLFDDDKVEHHSKYDSINAHIKGLFSLTKINKEEEIILANLSLLPTTGIRKYTFRNWSLNPNTMTTVQQLVDKGWVESSQGFIYLHPLVQAVIKDEVKPNCEICSDFLEKVIENVDNEKLSTISQMDELSKITLSIVNNLCEENEMMVKVLTAIGRFHNTMAYCKLVPLKNYKNMHTGFAQFSSDNVDKLKEFNKPYELYSKAGRILKRLNDIDDVTKEKLYTRFAALLYNIKKYDEAIEYNYMALDINLRLNGELSQDTMRNRRRIGTCYYTKKDYEKAFEMYNNNLQLRLANPPQSDENMGRSYMHVANALKHLNRFDEAMEHYKIAREYALKDKSSAIGLAMMDEEIVDLLLKTNKKSEAKYYLEEAIEVYRLHSDNEEKINQLQEMLEN